MTKSSEEHHFKYLLVFLNLIVKECLKLNIFKNCQSGPFCMCMYDYQSVI